MEQQKLLNLNNRKEIDLKQQQQKNRASGTCN